MMKRKIILYLCFVGVISCSPLRQDINTPTIITETSMPVPTSTITKSMTFTPSVTETIQPPLATLSSQNPSMTVKELLDKNNGCKLPCWWGVIPGQTNWKDLREALSPIADAIFEASSEDNGLTNVEVFFPAPYPLDGRFRQEYLVENGVVKRIEVLPQHYSKYSLPKGLLQEFGSPEMILLGGSIDPPQSFQLILYYPSQGIFALYSNELHPFQQQEILDVCFTEVEITYVDIFLWNPVDSFSQTFDYVLNQYERPFHEIDVVTNLTISEFSDFFVSPDKNSCLETPSSFWRN